MNYFIQNWKVKCVAINSVIHELYGTAVGGLLEKGTPLLAAVKAFVYIIERINAHQVKLSCQKLRSLENGK
jgi:hypothetical protein